MLATIFARIFRDFAQIFKDFARIFDKSKFLGVAKYIMRRNTYSVSNAKHHNVRILAVNRFLLIYIIISNKV